MELYWQAEALLAQEAVVAPLGYLRGDILLKPWVRKFPTSPIRFWFWKDVVIEPH